MGQWIARQTVEELNDVTLNGVVPLNRELGRGAYGCVFAVKYRGEVCAAKKIHPILISPNVKLEESKSIKDDFVAECLRCSSIRHPNVVQFLGVYYPSRASFPDMVMELMDTSLASFVEKNKAQIAFKTKCGILFDVSYGLGFLHSRKPQIIHRDLSPNNVMLTSKLVAKIGDLGVAKVVRADSKQTRSRLTSHPGTLHFMPPEALDEVNPIYGAPLDVFSFGGITLHVFSEEWPTPSSSKKKNPTTGKLIAYTEAERRQQYLDTMVDGEAAQLREITMQCLDDDPGNRPPIHKVSTVLEPLRESPSFAEALQGGQYHIKWNNCANLPFPLYDASVAVSGTTVYTAASTAPDVATPPGHMMGVLHMVDGHLCIFGGQDPVTNKTLNKVTSYNTITNSWYSRYPDMINERFKPGVVTYRDYVIVMGGKKTEDNIHNTIEVMNYCQHLQWKEVSTKLPVGMWNIRPTISGEKISIVGYGADGSQYNGSYEIAADDVITTPDQLPPTGEDYKRWIKLTAAPQYNTATVPNSSPAVIIGGSDINSVTTSDISLYDTSKKSWVRLDALTSPRKNVGVALVNATTIIIIGGTSGGVGVEANMASSLTTLSLGYSFIQTAFLYDKEPQNNKAKKQKSLDFRTTSPPSCLCLKSRDPIDHSNRKDVTNLMAFIGTSWDGG